MKAFSSPSGNVTAYLVYVCAGAHVRVCTCVFACAYLCVLHFVVCCVPFGRWMVLADRTEQAVVLLGTGAADDHS